MLFNWMQQVLSQVIIIDGQRMSMEQLMGGERYGNQLQELEVGQTKEMTLYLKCGEILLVLPQVILILFLE